MNKIYKKNEQKKERAKWHHYHKNVERDGVASFQGVAMMHYYQSGVQFTSLNHYGTLKVK
jgi:hypothetical protein